MRNNRSKSCSRNIAFYSFKEFSTINSKSTYLQNSSIVITILKTKSFKSFEIEYFYLDFSKDTHLFNNYII